MSKTYENLKEAFAGESMARNKYRKWAGAAKKEGHQAIAKIFEETSENEYEHASRIMKLMGDLVKDTEGNLESAVEGESFEWKEMYPRMLEEAKAEGNEEAVGFFVHVIEAEKHHAMRYANFLKLLREGKLYESDEEETWFCTNCGHVHKGKKAPGVCPTCKHAQGYFVRKCMLEYGVE